MSRPAVLKIAFLPQLTLAFFRLQNNGSFIPFLPPRKSHNPASYFVSEIPMLRGQNVPHDSGQNCQNKNIQYIYLTTFSLQYFWVV
jgi:hypothetical protein